MATRWGQVRSFLWSRSLWLLGSGWYRLSSFGQADLRRALVGYICVHWVVALVLLGMLVYRPVGTRTEILLYWGLWLTLVVCVGGMTYRVLAHRVLRQWYLLVFCFLDAVLVSSAVVTGGGFIHEYHHLFYYPVVASSGFVMGSVRASLLCCTGVVAFYVLVALGLGDGIDLDSREGRVLLVRVLSLYVVNAMVALSCRFERLRLRDAFGRERALLQERVEFSRSLHDTAAQSAYVVSLGLDAAAADAGERDSALVGRLRATSNLARGMVWQLRHLIDVGGLYEVESLRSAVRSHVVSFTNVTSLPVEFSVVGDEPELPLEVRRVLFTVAHNALANVYRHAGASRVLVELAFGDGVVSLTVSDDGVGLPEDYESRGQGFGNMARELERVGGRLVVERSGALGGAVVGGEVLT